MDTFFKIIILGIKTLSFLVGWLVFLLIGSGINTLCFLIALIGYPLSFFGIIFYRLNKSTLVNSQKSCTHSPTNPVIYNISIRLPDSLFLSNSNQGHNGAKFCTHCHSQLPEIDRFCPHCGTPVPQASNVSQRAHIIQFDQNISKQ